MSDNQGAFPAVGLDYNQLQIGQWGDRTFPASTPQSIAAHILREAVALYLTAHAAAFSENWEIAQDDLYKNCEIEIEKAWKRHFEYDAPDGASAYLADPQRPLHEAADILLLLCHYAHRMGFSLQAVMGRKFAEVQGWTFGAPDEQGVSEHETTTGGTVGATDPA